MKNKLLSNHKFLRKPIFINISIFIIYFVLCSPILINHSGGADIVFAALIFFCLLFHFLATIIIDIRNKKIANSLIVLILTIITVFTIDIYFKFMWWLTHKI